MKRLWERWVAYCGREEDGRAQALVRVLVPWAILLDLLRVAQLGLVGDLFVVGKVNARPDEGFVLDQFLDPQTAGLWAIIVVAIAFLLSSMGVFFRPMLLLGCLAYAQLGHLYSPGDRAIDRLLRTVLVIWAFGDSNKVFSIPARHFRPTRVRAWPADLVRYLLVIVYLSAGIAKLLQQPGWLGMPRWPVLYRVMVDPMAAHMDPVGMQSFLLPLYGMGWGTIAFELSAILILTRWRQYWAFIGIFMHLGIFLTMDLGMFSWGMLALYPLLLSPPEGTKSSNTTPA